MKTITKILAIPFMVSALLTSSCIGNYSPKAKIPKQTIEQKLKAKYGCISKAKLPNTRNMNLMRSIGKKRAEQAYLEQCVKNPGEANFRMIDIAYDFENGIAYGFAVK